VTGALPAEPGVYRFRDARGRVLYVGRATDLQARVRSYSGDLGDRRHLRPMVAAIDRIEAVVCASAHEAAWLERNLLEARLPRWNRTPGGQETPVRIALDPRPETPGLRLLHDRDRVADAVVVFGPYLGGEQVRRALTGLSRLHPLALTTSRPGATERAMAYERGVTEHDRGAMVAQLEAILGRKPEAIARAHDGLTARRDRAAAATAFELAARIHDELLALDWITSTQRVAVLRGGDADVHGWAHGVLVSFGVRDGRLCTWSQRRYSAAAAARYVATTPPAWREFADRNAALAATRAARPARPRAGRRCTATAGTARGT
jgi:excinuclease ABC subunit C